MCKEYKSSPEDIVKGLCRPAANGMIVTFNLHHKQRGGAATTASDSGAQASGYVQPAIGVGARPVSAGLTHPLGAVAVASGARVGGGSVDTDPVEV